jgi:prolyl-tRNA synthetase
MRQTLLFTKTRKEAPKDELSKNASFLIKAGFVHKEMAGVYSFLPLGLKVLEKISGIVRENMEALGAQELFLTTLQDSKLWQKTDRWDDKVLDVWFKTHLKNKSELGLASTHEEPVTNIVSEHLSSYKELPLSVFQIQTKFRNELRAKSGLIRGREFLMKDLYSFSKDETEHQKFYEDAKRAYFKIFEEVGLNPILTFASGGSFSKFSHEFQVISPAGEDTIFVDTDKKIAVNKEIYSSEVLKDLNLSEDTLEEQKSIEIGNIFELGTRFSEPLELNYLDENGKKNLVYMGSYGIGISRLMGTVAEVLSDENGLVWPSSITPFKVHLLSLSDDENTMKESDSLYKKLLSNKVEVLYDDRPLSAGVKFGDADLLGIPIRLVVSPKTISEGTLEVKERASGKVKNINYNELLKLVKND